MEFHCHVSVGKVANGQNCVGRCAYITGSELKDELTGESFNHTSKEEVVFSQTYLPDHAPHEWEDNPVSMWSSLQDFELSSRSQKPQLYREFELSLPNDLTLEQEKNIVEGICRELNDEGMCCTAGIHNKDGNHHAHIMAPLRRVDERGRWQAKSQKVYDLDDNGEKIPLLDKNGNQRIEKKTGRKLYQRTEKSLCWNDRENVPRWRSMICSEINKELGKERQLDHRSYAERGIERTPTIHHYGLSDRQAINEGITAQNERCEKLEREIEGRQKLISFEEKRGTERSSQREQHTVPEQTPGRDFSADIRGIKTSRAESSIESASERIAQISANRVAEALRLAEREQESKYEKQRTNMNAYDRDEERSHHMGHYL